MAARFSTLVNENALPTRWPDSVRCVLRLDPSAKTVCFWSKSPGDSPVRALKPEQVWVGFGESDFDIKISGYHLREVLT